MKKYNILVNFINNCDNYSQNLIIHYFISKIIYVCMVYVYAF